MIKSYNKVCLDQIQLTSQIPPYANLITVPRKLPLSLFISSSGKGRRLDVASRISGRNVLRQNSFISHGNLSWQTPQMTLMHEKK